MRHIILLHTLLPVLDPETSLDLVNLPLLLFCDPPLRRVVSLLLSKERKDAGLWRRLLLIAVGVAALVLLDLDHHDVVLLVRLDFSNGLILRQKICLIITGGQLTLGLGAEAPLLGNSILDVRVLAREHAIGALQAVLQVGLDGKQLIMPPLLLSILGFLLHLTRTRPLQLILREKRF